jgi:hypothetical protein
MPGGDTIADKIDDGLRIPALWPKMMSSGWP